MNGFKEDVIQILKTNCLLHREALGCVLGTKGTIIGKYDFLYEELLERKLPVANHLRKPVVYYSYIILPWYTPIHKLLRAFTFLTEQGILVLEVNSDDNKSFDSSYPSKFGNFTAQKVKYDDREYMVIHTGVDYGN